MNVSRFRNKLMQLMCSTENEEPFHSMRMIMGGLTAPKIAKIINYAVKCCDKDDAYVEIGTFSGFSLMAAAYQNNITCVGIDDLSILKETCFYALDEIETARQKCRETIEKGKTLVRNPNVMFIERDFRTIGKLEFKPTDKKIAVLYIDGYHSTEQTKAAFYWAEPQLADNSIIILDDLHMAEVYQATLEMVATGKYFLLLLASHTTDQYDNHHTLDEYISTGIAVLQYKGNFHA